MVPIAQLGQPQVIDGRRVRLIAHDACPWIVVAVPAPEGPLGAGLKEKGWIQCRGCDDRAPVPPRLEPRFAEATIERFVLAHRRCVQMD